MRDNATMSNNIHYVPERNINNIILVLDEDPKKAAKYLIKSHVINYIPILQNIFISYYKEDKKLSPSIKVWVNYIKRSKQNFIWTVTFYKTLQEIFKNNISKRKEYYVNSKLEFDESYLKLDKSLPNGRNEICLYEKHMDIFLDNKIKYKKLKESFINTNRIMYLKLNYPENLFVNSTVPPWYNKVNKTYELKNEIDNMNIRISRNNLGNYKFYCKPGLSDIWIEIKDVPSDIRFIINALLPKN